MKIQVSAAMVGGAMLCIAPYAAGSVTDATFNLAGEVENLTELVFDGSPEGFSFVDTGVNESFNVSGGTEVLPFSQNARGGVDRGFSFGLFEEVSVSGSGAVSGAGELSFSGSASASLGGLPGMIDFGTGGLATVSVAFTVANPSEYELVFDNDFDNDLGASNISLQNDDGTEIFAAPFFPDSGTDFGTLAAGTYTLRLSAFGVASTSVDFRVVPAPPTLAILACGALGARRRRSGPGPDAPSNA